MKAVLLAAGAATRMRPLTDDTPKCLLPVAGVPILRRTMNALMNASIDRFVIVTGFRGDQISRAVSGWFPGLGVEIVHNRVWADTNNGYSLFLAREAVRDGPMMLIDGDVVFDPTILGAVLGSGHEDCFALRSTRDLGAEEMKVELEAGRISAISKEIALDRAAGESVGLFRLGPSVSAIFDALADRIERRGLVGEWYEAAFDQAVRSRASIHAVDVGERYITEVDTPADLADAEATLIARGLA